MEKANESGIERPEYTGKARDLIKIRIFFINLVLLVYIWVASSFTWNLINF